MKKYTVPILLLILTISVSLYSIMDSEVIITTKHINQVTEGAPSGCECAALLQALRAKGKAMQVDYHEMLDNMPYATDHNPHHGFTGSPYKKKEDYQTIFPDALVEYANTFGKVEDTSGKSAEYLIEQIDQGRPSVVWVTSYFRAPIMADYSFGESVKNIHVVTLIGYKKIAHEYIIMDPSQSGKLYVSETVFKRAYNPLKYALTVY